MFRYRLQRDILRDCSGFYVDIAAPTDSVRRLLSKLNGGRHEIRTDSNDHGRLTDPGLVINRTPFQLGSDITFTKAYQITTVLSPCLE